jgi:hypothetical protein
LVSVNTLLYNITCTLVLYRFTVYYAIIGYYSGVGIWFYVAYGIIAIIVATRIPEGIPGYQRGYPDTRGDTRIPEGIPGYQRGYPDTRVATRIPEGLPGYQSGYPDTRGATRIPEGIPGYQSDYHAA